jgi:hypothetical protein
LGQISKRQATTIDELISLHQLADEMLPTR